MIKKFHPFHIVTPRPWPLISSILALLLTSQMRSTLRNKPKSTNTQLIVILTLMASSIWWKDIIKEAKKEGNHQRSVIKGLKIGILLFIASEVIFFLRFFWTYFHEGMSPRIEIGQIWPPSMVKRFNPINVPLLNTLILISSGVSITWSHHSLLNNHKKIAEKRLIVTCLLGGYFSILQGIEYIQAEFRINDSRYGSVFFLATGFHGIHVIMGTTFLVTTIVLLRSNSLSPTHHRSFEIAAWYWHFVDVVWLFLYLSIYWWGK